MSGSKHFDKIAWAAISIALVITILFMNGTVFGIGIKDRIIGYENKLFDNSRVHTIDIVMNDWDTFIDNARNEEYYTAALVIDGEAYKNVAIRGKGNTSLSNVSSMNSERYSFKVEFDHYDNSLTYHGLDKLSLNNLIQDSTMMKDYLTYTMMNEFGANAPLCSFAYITVNGEDWGLYLAVEGLEDAFLERNYGISYGELYKPDSMSFGGGRGNGKNFDMNDFSANFSSSSQGSSTQRPSSKENGFTRTSAETTPSTRPSSKDFSSSMPSSGSSSNKGNNSNRDLGGFGGGGMGGFGMGSSDVKLQYIDDNISSYSNIWNNAKTDITEKDQLRLIESLKSLSNYENIEDVVDIEQVIRYFVVHNFVCNGDSYTGSMIHNYYLYEENGKLSMLPWDYNLAYGTFSGGNATSTVNTPIDSPTSGGSEDRPMLHWIFESEEYTEMYHQYFKEFIETVDIVGIIDNAYNIIAPYVEKDPTKFYTYEQFELGVSTIRSFCSMRSESIKLQLENNETTTQKNYVDASSITLSNMGSMSMGGGGGRSPGSNSFDKQENGSTSSFGSMPSFGDFSFDAVSSATRTSATTESIMPGGFMESMPEIFAGTMPEGFMGGSIPEDFAGNMPEGFMGGSIPEDFAGNMPSGRPGNSQSGNEATTMPSFGFGDMSQRPSFGSSQNFGSAPDQSSGFTGNSTTTMLAISIIILAIGLIIAKLYKKY